MPKQSVKDWFAIRHAARLASLAALFWHNGSLLDLWDGIVDLAAPAGAPGHFGQPGQYLYRFQLLRGEQVVTLWFSDPFGRETTVYAHAHPEFPYNLVYETTREPNPMVGYFEGEFFAQPGMDYRKAFTRDYFLAVNRYWLDEYHVDGFRYDYVPGMYDGPAGDGYARLVFETYRLSQGIARFQAPDGRNLIIRCAEHLPDARHSRANLLKHLLAERSS